MSEKNTDLPKVFGVLILFIPSLVVRFVGEFIRFKSKARNSGKIFRDALLQQGIDESTASRLTATYLEGSDLVRVLRSFR